MSADVQVRCPGATNSQYVLRATVIPATLHQVHAGADGWQAQGAWVAALSPMRPAEPAQLFYRRLRQAEALGGNVPIVVPPPEEGLGHALRDRIQRAAGLGSITSSTEQAT